MTSIPTKLPYRMSIADRITYIMVFGIIVSLVLAFIFLQ